MDSICRCKLTFTILMLLLAPGLAAADINCADCNRATVAQAISDATTGTTINIPAGSCEWSSGVTIPDEKALNIVGAGAGSTIITATFADGTAVFAMGSSGSSVSYATIKGPAATEVGQTDCHLFTVSGSGWKIHHCALDCTTEGDALSEMIYVDNQGTGSSVQTGIIHSNTIHNGRIVILGSATMTEANAFWYRALGLGGADAVYIENNTITRDSGIGGNHVDANYGSAYVFRYNTCDGAYLEAHSLQYNIARGTRKWEVYNNVLNNSGAVLYHPILFRSGTGVIHNNSIIGNWTENTIDFDNVRSFTYYSGTHDGGNNQDTLSCSAPSYNFPSTDSNYNPGALVVNMTKGKTGVATAMTATTVTATLSDGAKWDNGDEYRVYRKTYVSCGACNGLSLWDGNTGTNGYPCRDQVGRGPDSDLWTVDETCAEAPGAFTQSLEPAYVWANYEADGETLISVRVLNNIGSDNHITLNRDYYLTEKSGYSAYTCPHPLTGLDSSCHCDSSIAGTGGYAIPNGYHTVHTGTGTQTFTGGAGTQTFTVSP